MGLGAGGVGVGGGGWGGVVGGGGGGGGGVYDFFATIKEIWRQNFSI